MGSAREHGDNSDKFLEYNGRKWSGDDLRAMLQKPRNPHEKIFTMAELEAKVAAKFKPLTTPSETSSTPRLLLGTAEGNDALLSGRGYSVRQPNGKYEVKITNPSLNPSGLKGSTPTLSSHPGKAKDKHETVRKRASIPSALKSPAPLPVVERQRLGRKPQTMKRERIGREPQTMEKRQRIGRDPQTTEKPASIPKAFRNGTPIPAIDLLEIKDEPQTIAKPASIPSAPNSIAPAPSVKRERLGRDPQTMGNPASIPKAFRNGTPIPAIDILEISDDDELQTKAKPASISSTPKRLAPAPTVKRQRLGREPQAMGKPASIPPAFRDGTPIPPIGLLKINNDPQTTEQPASNLSAPQKVTPTQSFKPLQPNEKPETGKVPATQVPRVSQHHLRPSTEAPSVSGEATPTQSPNPLQTNEKPETLKVAPTEVQRVPQHHLRPSTAVSPVPKRPAEQDTSQLSEPSSQRYAVNSLQTNEKPETGKVPATEALRFPQYHLRPSTDASSVSGEATLTQSLDLLQTIEKPETGKVPATEVPRFPQYQLRFSTAVSLAPTRSSKRDASQLFEPFSERHGVIIMQPTKPVATKSNEGTSVESELESELSTIDSDELEDMGIELGLGSSITYPCDLPLTNNSPISRAPKRQRKSPGFNRKALQASSFGQVEVSGKKRTRAVAFPDEVDEKREAPVPSSSPSVGALKARKKGIAYKRALKHASLSGQEEVKGKKRSAGAAFAEEVDKDKEEAEVNLKKRSRGVAFDEEVDEESEAEAI